MKYCKIMVSPIETSTLPSAHILHISLYVYITYIVKNNSRECKNDKNPNIPYIQRKEKKIELSFKIMTFCLKVYPLMLQPLQLKQSYYNWFVKTISSHFNSTENIFSLVDIKTYSFVSIL